MGHHSEELLTCWQAYQWRVQDTVLVIYTVGYPPRLVPVSLVLPGLDVRSSSVFASVPDAPAPAPAAAAKAPAIPPAVSAPDAAAEASAPAAELAGRVIALNRTAHAPTASFQSKALKVSTGCLLHTVLSAADCSCPASVQDMLGHTQAMK